MGEQKGLSEIITEGEKMSHPTDKALFCRMSKKDLFWWNPTVIFVAKIGLCFGLVILAFLSSIVLFGHY